VKAAFVSLILTICGVAGWCQTTPEQLVFEVASVKASAPDSPPSGSMPRNMDPSPGHFAMRNVSLLFCLEWAYDLVDSQIRGPAWIRSGANFDIVASAAGEASEERMKVMLRALLIDRFQLKVHTEAKEANVYALVLGKGTPKIRVPAANEQTGISGGPAGMTFHRKPLSTLSFWLTWRGG
jgi:uncharacterized protein (TIGR03435 family)